MTLFTSADSGYASAVFFAAGLNACFCSRLDLRGNLYSERGFLISVCWLPRGGSFSGSSPGMGESVAGSADAGRGRLSKSIGGGPLRLRPGLSWIVNVACINF